MSDTNYSDLKLKESALMAAQMGAVPNSSITTRCSSNSSPISMGRTSTTSSSNSSSPVTNGVNDTNRRLAHPAAAGATGHPTVPQRRTANDFRFGRSIGEGSFSTVYMAEDIHTRKEYASK